jgi:hypothetical protein
MEGFQLSNIMSSVKGMFFSNENRESLPSSLYMLISVPIVFHILENQKNSGNGRPSLTKSQRNHAINMANKLYNVYDKKTKTMSQFATFVNNGTILHSDFLDRDCSALSETDFATIVSKAAEWEFKFHVLVCETMEFSGRAAFPSDFPSDHPQHNAMVIDYRAFACFDDEGNFLCDPIDGKNVSHTRWWRSRSVVMSHEMGHLFGLPHTFSSSCYSSSGDGIADTPVQSTSSSNSCPGLLPYDRDRDLFDESIKTKANTGGSKTTCKGSNHVCGSSCASCCTASNGDQQSCPKEITSVEAITEDMVSYPDCCYDNTPIDSCPSSAGIDPLNNVMSYIPDWCAYEFTPGQLARMLAQTYAFKPYIYCNYANYTDFSKCSGIPCATTATSPYCATQ